jgi:hypothetical protein
MRGFAGILGIAGAIGTAVIGIAVCSVPFSDRSPLAEVFQTGRILVAIAGVTLGLNLTLMMDRLSRASCVLLGGIGCAALIGLGWIFATVIKGAT